MMLLIAKKALLLGAALLPFADAAQTAPAVAQPAKTEILLVGFDHLSQLYNQTEASDVLSAKRQQELARLNEGLQKFRPQLVLVEVDPAYQARLDSLYALYKTDKLPARELGRSETYQVGFALAKRLGQGQVYGVDSYSATSQGILQTGQNVGYYKNALAELQTVARGAKKQFQAGALTVGQHVALLNRPENLQLSHRALFNTPAYVMHGRFTRPDASIDTTRLNPRYIGAEFIALFYKRNLEIYSNILATQLAHPGQRMLLIMGQLHVGVLRELLAQNPDFKVVAADKYLK